MPPGNAEKILLVVSRRDSNQNRACDSKVASSPRFGANRSQAQATSLWACSESAIFSARNLQPIEKVGCGGPSEFVSPAIQFGIGLTRHTEAPYSGVKLRGVRPLPASPFLTLDFLLPDTSNLTRAKAEIVWQDAQGQSGLRFSHLQGVARRALVEWLKKNPGSHSRAPVITKTAVARK
jgi:hypothetical protein